jgi:glutamate/tyrosine decarboxylase-like PLP-dependent enzyme
MKTWEEAKVMELNINKTADDADENAGIDTTCLNWWGPSEGKDKNPVGGNNNGGSDSNDGFVDSLS